VIYATSEECAEHQRWLDLLGDDNPWRHSG